MYYAGAANASATSVSSDLVVWQARHFIFFQGGQNFNRLPRGEGQNMKKQNCGKNKIVWAKTQKITIFSNQGGGQIKHKKSLFFKIRGGGQMPPAPQMTSLSSGQENFRLLTSM